jgi:hypothetical protein
MYVHHIEQTPPHPEIGLLLLLLNADIAAFIKESSPL